MHSLIKCSSCGKPLTDFELQIFEKNKKDIAKLDNKILKYNLVLCSKCTANYSTLPRFISVASAFARYYFMERGIKNQKEVIQRAVNYISVQPYWRAHVEKRIESKNIAKIFESFQISMGIIDKYIGQEYSEEYEEERPDIFLSHSWNGPDKEVVDVLAKKLEELGYTIWYDKFKGLKPGDIEQYLETAVLDSFFCVPVICQAYFKGKFTVKELEMLYKFKEKKYIIPVWYSDINPAYLKSRGDLGKLLLNTAAITWDGINRNVDELARKIDEFISKSKNIEIYHGAELYEFEALALRKIESIIGTPIPQLPLEAQNDAAQNKIIALSEYEFGFAHHEHHVTALILRKIEDRIVPLRIFNSILSKLKYLRYFVAPLIELSPKLNLPKDLIEFNIDYGKVKYLPENIAVLSKLAIFSCKNVPIEKIHESAYPIIKRTLDNKNLYNDLDLYDAVNLFILFESMNMPHNIQGFSLESNFNFGYASESGKMIRLVITRQYIKNLPPIIGAFSKLQDLELRSYDVLNLPESIGNLKQLQTLSIHHNRLSSLPESIGKLKKLRQLKIYSTDLSSLPESIGDLTNLQTLKIYDNRLSSLPESIGQLSNLEYISLWGNRLSSLPESIGQLTNLKRLILYKNQLLSLPEGIGQISNLEDLTLRGNRLSSLPESIGQLTNLKGLNLESNKLSSVPEGIGVLKSLQRLDLSHNQLSALPEGIGGLRNLQELVLYDNRLSSLPESIGQLTNLQKIYLGGNQLSSLPESIGALKNLTFIDLSNNELSSLPESIGNLTNLQRLDLGQNRLSSLPENIGQLKNLKELNLGGDQLSALSERIKDQLRKLKNHGCYIPGIHL